ncbi:unnamed protein product [Echinostoma caproni]|uniref:KR domain-containing protein n=1 Tax=Echinostoma caproni TaxID=27848 RepID=A0A183B6A6_9TREM|nr:unnamed protein product [Echinostoma caproni]
MTTTTRSKRNASPDPHCLRTTRSQLAADVNLPGGLAFIEMGASLRRKVWDPMNAFVEGIINSQNIVPGEQIEDTESGYSNPYPSTRDQPPMQRVRTTEEAGFSIVHMVGISSCP